MLAALGMRATLYWKNTMIANGASRVTTTGFSLKCFVLKGPASDSWAIIMHKREKYREAFHNFDIDTCASMKDEELELILHNPGLIRNRNKIFSVRKNAIIVKAVQEQYGSFDAYLWSFTDGKVIDGHWETLADIPTISEVSIAMSKDMKKRGMSFVGPTITYSFLQSIGIVNDHLSGCKYRN